MICGGNGWRNVAAVISLFGRWQGIHVLYHVVIFMDIQCLNLKPTATDHTDIVYSIQI
jgi:hypothetical protein